MTFQTVGPTGSLVCYNYSPKKLQPPPNPSKTHLSCHGEQPSVYFQLTAWHFLTTHHCLASNILLPPWVSITTNAVVLHSSLGPTAVSPVTLRHKTALHNNLLKFHTLGKGEKKKHGKCWTMKC